jgi:hypothetical protein
MSRFVVVVLVAVAALAAPGRVVAAESNPPDTVVGDNEFVPDDRDLSDCISALPDPGCGSEGRSGWRQWLILTVIVAGLAFIAWRVVRTARRTRRST